MKIKIYKTIVKSITTYRAEFWETTEHFKNKLLTVRCCCGLTLQDKIRIDQIRKKTKIDTTIFVDTVETRCLRWYSHVGRMAKKKDELGSARKKRGHPRKM